MAIRGDWATNEVLTSDDLNDTINAKLNVSALGTALPLDANGSAASAGTATDISRVDHRHFLATHTHAGSTTGGNIPLTSVTDLTTGWTTENTAFSDYMTDWSFGNGYTNSKYKRFGKTLLWTAEMGFGSTTVFGTGSFIIAMPFPLRGDYRYQACAAYLVDASTSNRYVLGGEATNDGYRSVLYFHSSSGYMTATNPMTLASSDYIVWAGVFELLSAT
jgi:hypothetical protein